MHSCGCCCGLLPLVAVVNQQMVADLEGSAPVGDEVVAVALDKHDEGVFLVGEVGQDGEVLEVLGGDDALCESEAWGGTLFGGAEHEEISLVEDAVTLWHKLSLASAKVR